MQGRFMPAVKSSNSRKYETREPRWVWASLGFDGLGILFITPLVGLIANGVAEAEADGVVDDSGSFVSAAPLRL